VKPVVSIVVVTFNALPYVLRLLRSLPRTRDVDYELVVVDNRSRLPTRLVLMAASLLGRIQRLVLLDRNTLFSPANNIGAAASSRTSRYVLLLNSDVEVRDPRWLERLLELHEGGATSFGVATGEPLRADGYCLLVDRPLMVEHGLDESFEWFFGATKLQAELMEAGHRVRAVRDHDHLLYHFGGRSKGRKLTAAARGMDHDRQEIIRWFDNHAIEVLERA
jgi:GT2 family glycosyltransferase